MKEEQDVQVVALKIIQDHTIFLVPIASIKQILSTKEISCSLQHPNQVHVQEREIDFFSLSNLLGMIPPSVGSYVILLQTEEYEFFLQVEQVLDVVRLQHPYSLPQVVKQALPYIDECYCLEKENVGYLLNLHKLLNHSKLKQRLQEGTL